MSSRFESVEAEVIHRMKQELSQLGAQYQQDNSDGQYEVYQRLLARLDGSATAEDPKNPKKYMVTIAQQRPSHLNSFAVFADKAVTDKRLGLLEFKSQGRTVVQIVPELVYSYLEPPANTS